MRLAALDGEMVTVMRQQVCAVGGNPVSTVIGGGRTSADQAALLNSVLVRYVDLLDTYLTPGGLCHPADNFGAVQHSPFAIMFAGTGSSCRSLSRFPSG
jgi:2-methylcitrate dehydratase